MASGSDPDARYAELASLSGEKLVDLLRTTHRRADFEAVARVLRARDRRIAKAEAALSAIDSLRKKYNALLDEHHRSRGEAEEMAPLLGAAALDQVRRDEPRVEELDDVPLNRRLKRPRQGETSVVESVKRIGQGQSKPVATPEISKQGPGIVAPEMLGGGGMPRTQTLPLLSPGLLHRSVLLPKVSPQSGHGRAKFGKKEGSSHGVLAREVSEVRRGNGKIIQTSRAESSSTCASKISGTATKECRSLCRQRQTEEWRLAKGGLPMEETRMAASHPSLGIRSLSGAELRRYFLKPERTAPASSIEKKTQNFCDLTKRGNGLSKKLQGVSSKNKLLGGD
ncbi:hypothetical protein CFC21_041620 [Triticum aestivum]|uniref:Uncharacterized protein n=3 Tax=Triticum TaxID=4564 RepID=A0A9R1S347_TRITD|nr:hypothetical protein CFC21_041620 [Triticum aestivum]VAH78010.1 unnamed protein product [Triticum turgidum subsp. durum]